MTASERTRILVAAGGGARWIERARDHADPVTLGEVKPPTVHHHQGPPGVSFESDTSMRHGTGQHGLAKLALLITLLTPAVIATAPLWQRAWTRLTRPSTHAVDAIVLGLLAVFAFSQDWTWLYTLSPYGAAVPRWMSC